MTLSTESKPNAAVLLRRRCHGLLPLDARLEEWMENLFTQNTDTVHDWVKQFGSPLNIIETNTLSRNISELNEIARTMSVDFRVYFARKANKCLAFVDAAMNMNAGVDVASEQECLQVLQRGLPPAHMICTAAIKSKSLLELCVRQGVTVAIDNRDELYVVASVARRLEKSVPIALRLSGFEFAGSKLYSRFGFDLDSVPQLLDDLSEPKFERLNLRGLHFHLDGYCARQRIAAIDQCLPIIDLLRKRGHAVDFLDIGGGIPMSYLQHASQWEAFWEHHRDAMLGKNKKNSESLTYREHGLGLLSINGSIHGSPNVYPYFQTLVQSEWLKSILAAECENGETIAQAVNARGLQLRCEPGRSVLDGCGVTVARVEFVKSNPNGEHFIGLAMNRTQCRTSSDDFMVDPLVVPRLDETDTPRRRDQPIAGYLVGAYCTESELLTLRKLKFPFGIEVGDLVIFPNTAGYFMHFLESRSHQFPLAQNVVLNQAETTITLDAIDLVTERLTDC